MTGNKSSAVAPFSAAPMDESKLEMLRREKRMTVEQRLSLFERLSRDAAWIRAAKRVR